MKIKIILAALASTFILHTSAFAQGALTPPGAPAPTMKSLAQIEARIPISTTPYFIFTPGSYYLTGNLTVSSGGAIAITTNNVTLDLNGFTISSTASPAASSAIVLSGTRVNISIYNGHISSGVTNNASGLSFGGIGFSNGIFGVNPSNVRVKDVSVSGVLADAIGISGGASSMVESCTVNMAGGYGIHAESVSDSVANNCGNEAISASVASHCKGYGCGNGSGVHATLANNCLGSGSGFGDGVFTSAANNCYGYASGVGYGVYASDTATACSGYSVSGIGLSGFIAHACRGSTGSGTGLSVTHNVNSF